MKQYSCEIVYHITMTHSHWGRAPGGGYSHTLGIYGCAALMAGFVTRFAPMMGAF